MNRQAPLVSTEVVTTLTVQGSDIDNLETGDDTQVFDVETGLTWHVTRTDNGLTAEYVP